MANIEFEKISNEFLKENLYYIQIQALGGAINKVSPYCILEFYFDKFEGMSLSVDCLGFYASYDECHTIIHNSGNNKETFDNNTDVLSELKDDVISALLTTNFEFGKWVREDVFKFKEYPRNVMPEIFDMRKSQDCEYIYVVSLGVNNAIERTQLYKKEISSETLFSFLSEMFDEDCAFYKILAQHEYMPLELYDNYFLSCYKKECLIKLHGDEGIRSVYDKNGKGIKCPDCGAFIKYSYFNQKYECSDFWCSKQYDKKFLEEFNNSEIHYEELPQIFK